MNALTENEIFALSGADRGDTAVPRTIARRTTGATGTYGGALSTISSVHNQVPLPEEVKYFWEIRLCFLHL